MSGSTRDDLEAMRNEGFSARRREEFAAAQCAVEAWELDRGRARSQLGIEQALGWIDELRAAFGDPAVDRRPWIGCDFRL